MAPLLIHCLEQSVYYPLLLLPALLACLLLPTILTLRARARRLRLPPGPPGLPILGHLHLLGSSPHKDFADLSKRYGSLIYLRFGSVPVIVASSPTMAKLILQTHDQIFAWRPQLTGFRHFHGFKDITFCQPGPYWKLLRQLCATCVFGSKPLQTFRPMIAKEVRSMLSSIADSSPHELVHVRAILYSATSNIISKMTIGKKLQEVAPESQADPSLNLAVLVSKAVQLHAVFNVGDYIPWLASLDLQGYERQIKAVSQKLHRVLQEVIDARRSFRDLVKRSSPTQNEDFLDVLLSAAESKDDQISDFNIRAILIDMYAAGTDTSTTTIEWALAELLIHPLIMKRLKEELERVVGASRLVCESDIKSMPYLQAVVKEALRLHPVAPLLAPHMASQQCQLLEFDIPPNTHVYVNTWAIGRDPTVWDRPLEFCPERFLDSDIDVRGQCFGLLPFGSGRRGCPGLTLGLENAHVMLASLVQVFDWSIENPPSLEEEFGLVVTLANPLVAKASLKVSKHLLEAHE